MAEDRLMVSVSGVRGTIGGTLTPQVAYDFGCAYARMLGAGTKAVIGRDTRPSGPMIARAVSAGLLACGVNVVDLGVVTTPGVALMVRELQASGGVIVTASHNPPEYNGLKFLQGLPGPAGPPASRQAGRAWAPSLAGAGLTAALAGTLADIWRRRDFALAGVDGAGVETTDGSTHTRHIEAVCRICDVKAVAAGRFKVVLDSINGAGCFVTPMLLGRLGCEVVHINGEPTGRFAHQPEPIQENLTSLCEAVRRHGAAVGFAQDPDADRLVIVDEKGTFIGEEYTLALAAAHVLRHRTGKLATNLATSRMIDDVAAAAGAEVVRAPTGEANVVEAMQREGCIFGGEGNGGVIDPRVAPIRNSLVGMAMILQQMAETGKAISGLVGEIPSYVLVKTKMPCPAGAAGQVAARARAAFESRPTARFNDADGLRVDLPEGWVSIRGSNTEPVLRVFAEAADEATARRLAAEVQAIAEEVVGR